MPLAAVACVVSALGLAACSSSRSSPGKSSGSSSATLVMEGSPLGSMPRVFNPFSPVDPANTAGATNLVYEPLLQFNLVKPGTIYPWLATAYNWSNGGKTITFTLRGGVKFTDGEAFNAANVAWEFNLLKSNVVVNQNGLPIDSASATNPTTVVINFTRPVYTLLYFIAGNLAMLPEGVWSKVNPATYPDTNPVGTGPYQVSVFTSQGMTLTRNPHYWGGVPPVAKVQFPAYSSNTSANLALEQGQLDWAGNFVQNIKTAFVDKNPSTNHYWDAPLSTQNLLPNLTAFPFNGGAAGLAVRQAVSYGINRTVISTDGEDSQQPGATGPASLTGLVMPTDQSYVTPETSGLVTSYDPAKAKQVLQAAGWKMGGNGIFELNGKPLAFTIEDPSAYTDYITTDQIIAQELKQVGMDVSVQGVSVQKFGTDVNDGTFQMVNRYSTVGPTPYFMYDQFLDDSITAPIGKNATGDFERFYSPQAQALLAQFAATNDPATQLNAIVGMEKIVATQLPVIPIIYSVAWFDYSTSKFTGWPSPSDPYDPGQPEGPYDEYTILHLKPVG
ncbi:MAG TPA: ABC transporter substrate-binding protein [Streptosporangiaceae bacterium]